MARLRPPPLRPTPPPLETNDVGVAVAGTTAWIIALGVLLIIDLPREDRWWLWVCAAGIAIGLFAISYVPRLQRNRALAAERHAHRATAGAEPATDHEPGTDHGTDHEPRADDEPRTEHEETRTTPTGPDRTGT